MADQFLPTFTPVSIIPTKRLGAKIRKESSRMSLALTVLFFISIGIYIFSLRHSFQTDEGTSSFLFCVSFVIFLFSIILLIGFFVSFFSYGSYVINKGETLYPPEYSIVVWGHLLKLISPISLTPGLIIMYLSFLCYMKREPFLKRHRIKMKKK